MQNVREERKGLALGVRAILTTIFYFCHTNESLRCSIDLLTCAEKEGMDDAQRRYDEVS